MGDAELYKEMGRIIAGRRGLLGLRQADVAQEMGISRASLANIEVGRQRVLVHQLFELAIALRVEPKELLPMVSPRQEARAMPIADNSGLTASQRSQVERLLNSVADAKGR